MLDAFIIERIRQRREKRDSPRVPLCVEVPGPQRPEIPDDGDQDREREPTRGSLIIDDTI